MNASKIKPHSKQTCRSASVDPSSVSTFLNYIKPKKSRCQLIHDYIKCVRLPTKFVHLQKKLCVLSITSKAHWFSEYIHIHSGLGTYAKVNKTEQNP